MKRKLILCIFFISFTLGKNEIAVFFIPFDRNYIIDLNIENAKKHRDCTFGTIKSKKIQNELISFVSHLDTCRKLPDEFTIDIRMVVDFLIKNRKAEIGVDKHGNFIYNRIKYSSNSFIKAKFASLNKNAKFK